MVYSLTIIIVVRERERERLAYWRTRVREIHRGQYLLFLLNFCNFFFYNVILLLILSSKFLLLFFFWGGFWSVMWYGFSIYLNFISTFFFNYFYDTWIISVNCNINKKFLVYNNPWVLAKDYRLKEMVICYILLLLYSFIYLFFFFFNIG